MFTSQPPFAVSFGQQLTEEEEENSHRDELVDRLTRQGNFFRVGRRVTPFENADLLVRWKRSFGIFQSDDRLVGEKFLIDVRMRLKTSENEVFRSNETDRFTCNWIFLDSLLSTATTTRPNSSDLTRNMIMPSTSRLSTPPSRPQRTDNFSSCFR